MTERERVLEEATNFCFYSDTPLGEVSHEQIHNLMADFHLAQSAEITAERDRLREWVNGLMDIGWRDKGTWVSILQFPDGTYAAMNNTEILAQGKTPYEALTAYLKGKGDGAKGE